MINHLARPGRGYLDPFDGLLDQQRRFATIAALGLKFKTGLKQRLSLLSGIRALSDAGPRSMKWLA